MVNRRRILLAGLLVAVFAGVACLLLPSREPIYQGKPLSYWLEGYNLGNYNLQTPSRAIPADP
jgi:hypothetical protein